MRLEVTRPARADIGAALRWSEDHFGPAARFRYRTLIDAGLETIAVPNDPVSVRRVRIGQLEMLLFHLRNCKAKAGISRPRHVIAYHRPKQGLIVVTRLLYDAMDLPAHLRSD